MKKFDFVAELLAHGFHDDTKKADPDGKLTSGALVDVRKKAFDRVCRLRDALDDFNSQEW